MKKLTLLVLLICALSGCASVGKKLNRISLGMSKSQVMDVMGDPDSIKASNNTEILVYEVDRGWSMEGYYYTGNYWVVLENGKVSRYGKPGDFGTPAEIKMADHEEKANAQTQDNLSQAILLQQSQPARAPMQPYQLKTPTRTNCNTNAVGGADSTNCSTY